MTTDEKTPATEPLSEDDISKNLLRQVGIVGAIVFLVLLAVFFGAI